MKKIKAIWIILLMMGMMASLAAAEMDALPDTGQTQCYDDGNEIPCPAPGEDFYGQDAQYEGVQMAFQDNGDGTVSDLTTGLDWQQSDDGTERPWADAGSYCEHLVLGGHSDWRLPTKKELVSIVDYGTYDPAIDPVFECRSSYYWSGSTYADNPDDAWFVGFGNGDVHSHGKSNDYYVRCVRSRP